MKIPKGLEVKWANFPTTFDQTGCQGLYIQEITVKWWVSLKIIWFIMKNYDMQITIAKRFKFKMPNFILFIYFIIRGRKSKLIRDYLIGG